MLISGCHPQRIFPSPSMLVARGLCEWQAQLRWLLPVGPHRMLRADVLIYRLKNYFCTALLFKHLFLFRQNHFKLHRLCHTLGIV